MIETFTQKIRNRESFSFIKLGDGEDFCMRGVVGKNCDHHPYSKELGDKLKAAFEYFQTRKDCFVPLFNDQVFFNTFLHRVDNDNIKVKEFFGAVREHTGNKVYVGPARLNIVPRMLGAKHIVVPQINAFSEFDRVLDQIKEAIWPDDKSIVLFSSGMMAKSLIHETLVFSGLTTCIDIGSSFDPMVNQTRTNQLPTDEILRLYSDWLNG